MLIGLTVAAASMVFLMVMPMMEPKSNLDLTNTCYYYDGGLVEDTYVVEFTVMNSGTKVLNIASVELVRNDGNTISHKLHTPEYLEEDLQPLTSFDFFLTFVRLNPPAVFKIRVTLDGGQTYYSELLTLS